MDGCPQHRLGISHSFDFFDRCDNLSLTSSLDLFLFSFLLLFDHSLHVGDLRVGVERNEKVADEAVASESAVVGADVELWLID